MSIEAVRSRTTWAQLPDGVRALVSERTGPVVTATSHEGGYSPGMAATLVTEGGDRVFVKVASRVQNEFSAELYRREAAVNEALRPVAGQLPAPAFRWSAELETGGNTWVMLAFDAADGPGPGIPWQPGDLAEALDLVAAVGRVAAPEDPAIESISALEFGEWAALELAPASLLDSVGEAAGWLAPRLEQLAGLAAQWPEATEGTALVHHDLRADNMVRSGGRLLAVDWPYASRGVPWLDLLGMLPSVALEGGGEPEELFTGRPVGAAADPGAVTVAVAALTGMFLHRSLQPPPAGIPHLRGFQRDQGLVGVRWLQERLR
ncbi:aminoglycoside phosphotransferase family protein [Ruania suaedae]|uniref:phosphotransferase family protein n=1 Tax=Ruania suaedae TaxID=2897774 RepID=UPI001E593E52|nr:phosphotransferase [Ruania suaedae]UFU02096.1 aminoglycoside phosphotransferase family protein [Ruania suaedae]